MSEKGEHFAGGRVRESQRDMHAYQIVNGFRSDGEDEMAEELDDENGDEEGGHIANITGSGRSTLTKKATLDFAVASILHGLRVAKDATTALGLCG
jgi:hypothetical protein